MNFITGITNLAHALRRKRLSFEVIYRRADGTEKSVLASPWFSTFQDTQAIDYEAAPALTRKIAQWTILADQLHADGVFIAPKVGDEIIDQIGGVESVNKVESIGGTPQWMWNPNDPSKKTIIVSTVRKGL